jgi:hypothetical protein
MPFPGSRLWFRLILLVIVASLYIAACASPACTWQPGSKINGWFILELGWVPGPWTIPWFANILLVIGSILLLCNKHGTASCLAVAGALLGLTTLVAWDVWYDSPGCYLWQASLIIFSVGTITITWNENRGTNA